MNNLIRTPLIFKENSAGAYNYAIQDEMLCNREIDLVGQIIDESAQSFILQLRYLRKQDPNREITMYINSPCGSISSGLAIYDFMKAVTCPIKTVCVAQASSMAAIIFASGNKREMLSHAKIMIHDPRIERIGGTALEINEFSNDLTKTREMVADILAKQIQYK